MTASDIKKLISNVYLKIQQAVTDTSTGSIAGSLFYAISVAVEDVYSELAAVKTQSTAATATGTGLDSVIKGTYTEVTRGNATRALGYQVLYADNPILNTANVVLTCAKLNSDGSLSNVEGATRFTGKVEEGNGDKVFVLIEPDNQTFVKTVGSSRIIDFKTRQPQFLILPIASLDTGSNQNLNEGDIAVFPNTPLGISGAENIYNLYERFSFSSQKLSEPLQSRFTSVVGFALDGKTFTVTNGFFFSKQNGLIEFYSRNRAKALTAVYRNGLKTVIKPFRVDYTLATNNSIILTNNLNVGQPVPRILQEDTAGNLQSYYLESLIFGTTTYVIAQNGTILTLATPGFVEIPATITLINSPVDGLNIQEVFKELSPEIVLDPDKKLVFSTGELSDDARLSGGSDAETDDSYRRSLQKYLASLGKGAPKALESAALSTDGINFAKTLSNIDSPIGAATVVVANSSFGVAKKTLSELYLRLDEEEKAAGIHAILRTPTPTYLNFSLDITLQTNFDKSVVYNSVVSTVDTYLGNKSPGEVILYSDLIKSIREVAGVDNVKSLIIGKELSQTYYNSKKLYIVDSSSFPYMSDGVNPISGYHAATIATAWKSSTAHTVGTVYNPNNPTVIIGNYTSTDVTDVIWNTFIVDLKAADTVEKYKRFLRVNYKIIFGGLPNEFEAFNQFCLLLAQPVDGNAISVPLSIERAIYSSIVDYKTQPFEITDIAAETVGTEIKPLVGIRFLTV